MQVRILVSAAGLGFSVRKGEVADLPDDVAESLIAAGYATKLPGVEDARPGKVMAAEKAVGKASRGGGKRDGVRHAG